MGMNMRSSKKRFKYRVFIFIIILYILFCYSFYYSLKNNKDIDNEEFIKILLTREDYSYLNEYKNINILNSMMKYVLNIDITKPNSILNTTIFKNSSDIKLSSNIDYSDIETLKEVSSYMKDPNDSDISEPIVYIYNSHQLENYNSENLDIYGITPNVLMASYILKEKLNDIGISTIVEDTNMSEMLAINNWDYSNSYKASRLLILSKISEYPSIKYFIDIHRDSVDRELSTVSINNKNYARVLFVVGQDYDSWNDNYNNILTINNYIDNMYPNLSRGILKKSGVGVDGVYNQDISSRCILIELGSVDNTIEEVFNTINVLTNVLAKYIEEDK